MRCSAPIPSRGKSSEPRSRRVAGSWREPSPRVCVHSAGPRFSMSMSCERHISAFGAALLLSSPAGAYITGIALPVDVQTCSVRTDVQTCCCTDMLSETHAQTLLHVSLYALGYASPATLQSARRASAARAAYARPARARACTRSCAAPPSACGCTRAG